jgi:hypothetical protein
MAVVGTLIAESLQVDAVIEGVQLAVTRIARVDAGDVAVGQPRMWTFIEFAAHEEDVDVLARSLERALRREGGWYCDFRSETETFVVFAGRTFRYARGDGAGRADATSYARAVGVPEAQLDWPQ